MRYLLAIDSFKGCLSSSEAERAVAEAISEMGHESVSIPMSDGGEGMLDAFLSAVHGTHQSVTVHDPLMRHIKAEYGLTTDGIAIIETARACGLTLMSPSERNPLIATSYGVGELIAHAMKQGCRRFIIGLGGSGTSDAGIGMLKALVDELSPKGNIDDVRNGVMGHCSFTLACDVSNPLYGPNGAASVFGPQKGATDSMISQIDHRALRFAQYSAHHCGHDCSLQSGAGAAGGLGYAFMQYFKASFQPGADLLFSLTDFDRQLSVTDCVITGEGHADHQTLMGKLPHRILSHAKAHRVPVWLVAGRADDTISLLKAGFNRVESITPEGIPLKEALQPQVAMVNLQQTIRRMLLD